MFEENKRQSSDACFSGKCDYETLRLVVGSYYEVEGNISANPFITIADGFLSPILQFGNLARNSGSFG